MSMVKRDLAAPMFWRDDALPFIEARLVRDGRKVRYARHVHETFSIGIVTKGRCTYWNRHKEERIGAGTVVLMNPGDAHACNPIQSELWSYRMLYVDVSWLTGLQHDLGVCPNHQFRPFSTISTARSELYTGLHRVYDVLTDEGADCLEKQSAVITFLAGVQTALSPSATLARTGHQSLARAAEYIRQNYARPMKLDEICAAAELSPSYLIRAFKESYGLTPHAYLTNCRIEFSRSELRRGRPIAEVALEAGFADQAHLQRSFKKVVAATPGQYRG